MTEEFDDPELNKVYSLLEGYSHEAIKGFLIQNYDYLIQSSPLWQTALKDLNLDKSSSSAFSKLTKLEVLEILKKHFHSSHYSGLVCRSSYNPSKYESPDKDIPRRHERSGSSAFCSYESVNPAPKISCFANFQKRECPSAEFSTKCNSQLTLTEHVINSVNVKNLNHYEFRGQGKRQHTQIVDCSQELNLPVRINHKPSQNTFINKKRIASKVIEKGHIPPRVGLMLGGLKDISRKVIDILKSNEAINYKMISETILNQLLVDNENECKNIRRRIYDTINVLKAINCLKQDSKKLITINKEFKDKPCLNEDLLIKEISSQTIINNSKRQTVTLNLDTNSSLKSIVTLNKTKDLNQNEQSQGKLAFPFFCFLFDKKQLDLRNVLITSTSNKDKLFVASDDPISIRGDFDILKRTLRLKE